MVARFRLSFGSPTAQQQLVLILAAGFVIRALLFTHQGYPSDERLFESWAAKGAEFGVTRMYDHTVGDSRLLVDYPPVMLYLYSLSGKFVFALQHNFAHTKLFVAAIKFWAILADCIAAVLLFRIGGKHSEAGGGTAAGLFFLLPASWLDSAVWGQVDSIYSLLLFIAFVAIANKKATIAGIAAGIAFVTKYQVLAFLPVLAVIGLAIDWRMFLRAIVAFVITIGLVVLPFVVAGQGNHIVPNYLSAVEAYRVVSIDAFNLWYLLFGTASRHLPDTGQFAGISYKTIGLSLYTLALGSLLVTAWKRIRITRAPCVLLFALGCASIATLCFFLLPTEMHERYSYPFVMFSAIWAAQRKSHLAIYLLIAVCVAMNIASQMPIAISNFIFSAIPNLGRIIAVVFLIATTVAIPRLIRLAPMTE